MLNRLLFVAMALSWQLLGASVFAQADYARDIRPILSANCFQCHGPDENKREADLRLDRDTFQLTKVAGSIEDSELLRRISSEDPDALMPPPDSNKDKLTQQQIELIKIWIAQGAKVAGHWSYEPVSRPRFPKVKDKSWSRNPIDLFVLAKLERNGLKPSQPAEKSILRRRISLDLVGLPSSTALPAEIMELEYSQMVETLLASPAFGERMAIEWLDLVRYADTSGIHSDNPISMSPYRDYVIDAFNANMPFDQFTREQLAGDLMPQATLRQKIASAFNRLNMMTTEGGAQDKEYLAKYAADRVRTTSMTWLGSTLGCAECHDHKYDPFSTGDFYRFAAFFADITEKGYYPGAERSGDWGPKLSIPTSKQLAETAAIEKRISDLQAKLEFDQKVQLKNMADWVQKIKQQPSWSSFANPSIRAESATVFKQLPDGSYLTQGKRADTDIYFISTKEPPKKIKAIRVEVLPHASLPGEGPGRAGNGNFVLTEIKLQLKSKLATRSAKFSDAVSTFDQILAGEHSPYKKWHALSAIDENKLGPKPGWAILPKTGQPNSAVFILEKAIEPQLGEELIIQLEQQHDNPGHVMGRFRLTFRDEFDITDVASLSVPGTLKLAIQTIEKKRTELQRKQIEDYFLKNNSVIQNRQKEIAKERRQLVEKTKNWTTVLTTVARKPREMKILPRGDWLDESGPVVTSGVPAFLDRTPKVSSMNGRLTRMDLAHWIVSPLNPLTARVQVNRLWKKFFGRGLVATSDDFGSQGSVPSHPRLLDFLAAEYIESGWDTKHVVRMIVNSATYRQSSVQTTELLELDPANNLLTRQNSIRIDAELLRDQALAASGLLVDQMGGPSVKPYQPAGYYQHLNFPRRVYQPDRGRNQYRRAVYTHWQRLFLHPSLLAFDAPSREECTPERVRSNTPQQALVLLNDPSFVEAARIFAAKIVSAENSFDERIRFAYQTTFGRNPTRMETGVLRRILDSKIRDSIGSQEILNVGDSKQAMSDELVAWTAVARVIFNLHEFTTRY